MSPDIGNWIKVLHLCLLFSFSLGCTTKIVTETLPDGEVTVKVLSPNLTLTQTSTDGYNLMQGEVINCDYKNDLEVVRDFEQNERLTFNNSDENCSSNKDTEQGIDGDSTAVLMLARNGILVEKCREFHEKVKKFSLIDRELAARRRKRDLLRFPGTYWCGSGYSGKNFKQLGHNAAADRCCRDHDHCYHTIAPFETKYHYFNYRFHTISHCRCDERFRSCLRSSKSGASNLIGKLYFNVYKTKCFVLEKEKTCKKRDWWGACIKKRKTRRAYIKYPETYLLPERGDNSSYLPTFLKSKYFGVSLSVKF